MFLPITKSCYKILRVIYTNLRVKVSKLLQLARVSQKIGYKHLEELLSTGIIKEVKENGIRSLMPNLTTRAGQLIFSLMELEFEYELINTYPELKESLVLLRDKAHEMSIDSAVIFGDFLKKRGNQDIDLMVISELKDNNILPLLKKCFSSINNQLKVRVLSKAGFNDLKESKPEAFRNFFNYHVCVLNPQLFLRLSS